MTGERLPIITLAGAAIAAFSAVAFFVLINFGVSRQIFGIAAIVFWIAIIAAARPLVERTSMSAFWFSAILLGFFLFFVDETYEYEGRVRLFPLLIGYLGIILCLLDLFSLTVSKAGALVTRFFGKAFDPKNLEGRSAAREIIVIAAICLIVAAIYVFGFLVATPLSVVAWMVVAGRKGWGLSLATGAGAFVFVWSLFEIVLRYELYRGLLWELLRG